MANFDTLLSGLHNLSAVADKSDAYLEVNSKRQFIPTNNFDTVIGYEGDINSQVILFKLPETYDSHKLSECQIKLVKWKNNVSGFEGTSNLIFDGTYYNWKVDPSVFTKAGTIEISLTFEDKKDKLLVYSWNTSTYLGLSVGKSINTVDYSFPAKDEILTIDKETKNIIAPAGYNSTICTLGDVDTVHVYFLISRFLGSKSDFDILGDGVRPAIYLIANNNRIKDTENLTLTLYTEQLEDRNNEGLVFIDWAVPSKLTSGALNANGFEFAIEFAIVEEDGQDAFVKRRWLSRPYNGLKIGQSILQSIDLPGTTASEEYVYELIDNFFRVRDITWADGEEI